MNKTDYLRHTLARILAIPISKYPKVIKYFVKRKVKFWFPMFSEVHLNENELCKSIGVTDQEALVDYFVNRKDHKFFVKDDPSRRAAYVLSKSSDVLNRIKYTCNQLIDHKFDILGSGLVDIGDKISWRKDIKSGYEWPQLHFTRLKLVDLDAGVDIKVPWELSRFHHAVVLGQGYALTGDESYVDEFVQQLNDWWSDNPCELGPNWANAMEVSIRAVNLIWAYELMRNSVNLDKKFIFNFVKSLCEHGKYIVRNLEDGWPGSNHYIADLCGLVWLGIYLQPFSESKHWLDIGLSKLTEEISLQVHNDGTTYEDSTSYHVFITEMIFWTYMYCELNGVDISIKLRNKLINMFEVISAVVRPDGGMPLFGDCDSGRWITLESDRDLLWGGQDPCGLLFAGAIFFSRDDWQSCVFRSNWDVKRQELSLWIFGDDIGDVSHSSLESDLNSIGLLDSGWYVMRGQDSFMVVQAGKTGSDGWGGHSHNDVLSFEFVVGDRLFVADPGSYVYTQNYALRNMYRSTAYHNVLQVESEEMNRIPIHDLFRLNNDVKVTVNQWVNKSLSPYLDVEYVSDASVTGRTIYHRRIFEYLIDFDCWLLSDSGGYLSDGEDFSSELSIYFHCAKIPVELNGDMLLSCCDTSPNIAIFPLGGDTNKQGSVDTNASICNGFISARYGVQEEAVVLQYKIFATIRDVHRTILMPFESASDLECRYNDLLKWIGVK
tara:strand:+ start:161 stop:2314 length:2154 start_codon:yes stop_codon:yes gene_type:complete